MQQPGNEQVLHVSKPSNTLGGLDFNQDVQGGIFSVQLKDHSPGPQTGKDDYDVYHLL